MSVSAVVLAGGQSKRMGSDKAFLKLGGRAFVSIIARELMKLSDDVIVVAGKKKLQKFEEILDREVKVVGDEPDLGGPVSGIWTGLNRVKYSTTAIVACDLPLLKSEVIEFLWHRSLGHSAAVPIWPDGGLEPLCGAYKVRETKAALKLATSKYGRIGPRHIINELKDVIYVEVSNLKPYDRLLGSLFNVNSQEEYLALLNRIDEVRFKESFSF
jgi:molybdopterin-guanine dinucleotide biosynthesis protein A